MKKLLTLLLFITSFTVKGQEEFSFEMYFEDAVGNRDTVVLGYDNAGTDTIDIAFNELNIINTPLDSAFDVRITNGWNNSFNNDSASFHTKKQIVNNNCGGWFGIISIDIKCSNWPVTASWNNGLFFDSCNVASLFTSITPGGWFDTGSPSNLGRVNLIAASQVTFSSNNANNGVYYNENYEYINNSNDTVAVFWVTFGDSSLFSLSINEKESLSNIKIYPNPAQDEITVQLDNEDGFEYTIINISGQIINSGVATGVKIKISEIPNGYYILQVQENRKLYSTPFVISR